MDTSNSKGLVKMCQDQVIQGNPNHEKYVRSFSIYTVLSILRNVLSPMKCCLICGSAEHSLQVAFT